MTRRDKGRKLGENQAKRKQFDFEKIKCNKDFPLLMGLWLGDGSSHTGGVIWLVREAEEGRVRNLIHSVFGECKEMEKPLWGNSRERIKILSVNGRNLLEWVEKEFAPNKEKQIPLFILKDRGSSKDLLCGLFQADGGVKGRLHSEIVLTNTSKILIYQVCGILEKEGLKFSCRWYNYLGKTGKPLRPCAKVAIMRGSQEKFMKEIGFLTEEKMEKWNSK